MTTTPGDLEYPAVDYSALAMPIGEAMFTQRAIRRMKADPVPVEHLRLILEAAVKAPNGGNNQRARFLVVTDRDKITAYGHLYRDSWWAKRKLDLGWSGPDDVPEGDRHRPAMRLAEEMKDVPCLVFVLSTPPHHPESVLPAAQNLMLAARALGIGSVPTRLHEDWHERFRALFGVPDDVLLHLGIPLGYPRGNFGPTRRLPTAQTTCWDAWGAAVPWA